MTAYYNEHDAKVAAWLRELIRRNLIAPGDVDERDILDVRPSELVDYEQCHFFAGIGVWSYALRQAGWPDDEPVWTGSCPCQPFSAAGQRRGVADERHLWPAFHWLIGERRPDVVFGEQVESKDGRAWLDTVQADLEGLDYAVGPIALPAAGFGAPHIRSRLFWVAESNNPEWRADGARGYDSRRSEGSSHIKRCGTVCSMAHSDQIDSGIARGFTSEGIPRLPSGNDIDGRSSVSELAGSPSGNTNTEWQQRSGEHRLFAQGGEAIILADDDGEGLQRCNDANLSGTRRWGEGGVAFCDSEPCGVEHTATDGLSLGGDQQGDRPFDDAPRPAEQRPGVTRGYWSNADWLYCRDEKYRPVEPGTFPLAHWAPARMGCLRGYGNAIVAPVAKEFIQAYMYRELT